MVSTDGMKKMIKIFYRFLSAIVLALIVFVIVSFSQSNGLRYSIGFIIGLPSLVLLLISRRQLGKSFSAVPKAKGLVTSGLYAKIQHPMYIFLDLFLAALILVLGLTILLVPWGFLVVMQIIQAHREEQILASAFGTDYSSYVSRTWF
jgi:protein-S-isoprenylcysteine O-methyltransferase Ste14